MDERYDNEMIIVEQMIIFITISMLCIKLSQKFIQTTVQQNVYTFRNLIPGKWLVNSYV